jgi:hypothetical protein
MQTGNTKAVAQNHKSWVFAFQSREGSLRAGAQVKRHQGDRVCSVFLPHSLAAGEALVSCYSGRPSAWQP